MKIKAGLDFGTTTSILAYFEEGKLKRLKYGGEGGEGTEYVPTAVAYDKDELHIGQFAVSGLSDEARVYRYFKMQLPVEEDNSPSASELTADFIGELIGGRSPSRTRLNLPESTDDFETLTGHEIEYLVIAVPQVWHSTASLGRQRLQQVAKDELQIPEIRIISEPIAAAAYFSYLHQKKKGETFQGNLLVCDMGGGSFDVSLCHLSNNRVEVLHYNGNGETGLGIAGTFFDELLIDKAFGKTPEGRAMVRLMIDLENEKKNLDNTKELLTQMRQPPRAAGVGIYTLFNRNDPEAGYRTIKYPQIEEVFAEVKAEICRVIKNVVDEAERDDIRVDKVLLVGGFSKFPLVQKTIAEFFSEDIFAGCRLLELEVFDHNDMAFAVSNGACLIANGIIDISEKFDYSISILGTNLAGEDVEVELVKAGSDLDKLSETNLSTDEAGTVRLFRFMRNRFETEIVIGSSSGEKIIRRISPGDLPNFDTGNRWHIGAYVDSKKNPRLVVQDVRKNERREYSLTDLIPEINPKNQSSSNEF